VEIKRKIKLILIINIKNHSNSYDEIRNHVLETPESKENAYGMVLGNLPQKI
jgi:hypothetical protein